MKSLRVLLLVVACLVAWGCDDSRNPLSDPKTAKVDERLIGLWRSADGPAEDYYHVGRAGDGFPAGMLRIIAVKHEGGKLESPEEYLAFSTTLQGKTYLNMVVDPGQVKRLSEKGWKPETVDGYTFVKYAVDGDKLTVWVVDEEAKQRAIKNGKIKGATGKNNLAQFTDSTENVARFVSTAGDSLLDLEDSERLERVKPARKR